MTNGRGRLVLVVGPSGAGKDSILQYAKDRFAGNDAFLFPRRLITRMSDATEDHVSIDANAFEDLLVQGRLALHWQAHGFRYGIRDEIDSQLELGQIVSVNVSRTILGETAQRYPTAVIVEISASPTIRAARIATRGRESAPDATLRSQRTVPVPATTLPLHVIENEGDIAEAGAAFCAVLRQLAPDVPATAGPARKTSAA